MHSALLSSSDYTIQNTPRAAGGTKACERNGGQEPAGAGEAVTGAGGGLAVVVIVVIVVMVR